MPHNQDTHILFYNSHQTELCDREGKEGKDGGKNSIEEQMALCTLFFALAAFKGCREKRSNLLMERKKRNSGLDKMPKKKKIRISFSVKRLPPRCGKCDSGSNRTVC